MSSYSTRAVRSVAAQGATRILGIAAGFISLGLVARYLEPGLYGQLTTAAALVGIFSVVADCGINSVVLRRVNAEGADIGELTKASLGLTCLYVLPVCAAFVLAGLLIYPASDFGYVHDSILGYAAGLAALCFSSSIRPLYQQQMRLGFVGFVELVTNLSTAAASALITLVNAPALLIFYVQALYPFIGLSLLCLGQRQLLRPALRAPLLRSLVREAAPLAVGTVVAGLYLRIDMLLMSLLQPTTAVGAYGLAYRVISALSALSVFMSATVFPRLAEVQVDADRYRSAFSRGLLAMLAVAAPMAIGVSLVADQLIGLLSSTTFNGADRALSVLGFVLIPVFLNALLGSALAWRGLGRAFLLMSATCLCLNIVLNLILIPEYGPVGAAAATLGTECLSTVVIGWLLRADLDVRLLSRAGWRLAGSLAGTATVIALLKSAPLVVTVLASCTTYAVLLLLTGALRSLGLPRHHSVQDWAS